MVIYSEDQWPTVIQAIILFNYYHEPKLCHFQELCLLSLLAGHWCPFESTLNICQLLVVEVSCVVCPSVLGTDHRLWSF